MDVPRHAYGLAAVAALWALHWWHATHRVVPVEVTAAAAIVVLVGAVMWWAGR